MIISSKGSVELKRSEGIAWGGGLEASGELARAEPGFVMRMRLERVRCGYSHSIPRAEHRRQAGRSKSQRRLDLVQAAQDLPRDGGNAR